MSVLNFSDPPFNEVVWLGPVGSQKQFYRACGWRGHVWLQTESWKEYRGRFVARSVTEDGWEAWADEDGNWILWPADLPTL